MAAEAKMSTPTLCPLVLGLLLVQFVQVGIQYNSSIQFDLHEWAIDGYFLLIPFPDWL